MSETSFFQTVMGRTFFEGHVPALLRVLKRIADGLEASNKASAEDAEDPIASILEAQRMGFEVREDADQPGKYLFNDPSGEGSDISFGSELEAWRQVVAELPTYQDMQDRVEAEYVASGGTRCPRCGVEAIEGNEISVDAGTAWQQMFCNGCGAEWQDNYKLVGITRVFSEAD